MATPAIVYKIYARTCGAPNAETYFVFEFESADVVLLVDRKVQQYFADVRDAFFLVHFHFGRVQQGTGVRPKHFDVTMIVQPVQKANRFF